MAEPDTPQPPRTPQIKRSLSFHPLQQVGVPLLLLVPVLAVLGLFGETKHISLATQGPLEVRLEYPARMRYKTVDAVELTLSNASQQALSAVTVRVDRAYLQGFSSVSFTPDLSTVTGSAYVVEIGSLPAGESRTVTIHLQAERYGNYQGAVEISANGASQRLRLATFNVP